VQSTRSMCLAERGGGLAVRLAKATRAVRLATAAHTVRVVASEEEGREQRLAEMEEVLPAAEAIWGGGATKVAKVAVAGRAAVIRTAAPRVAEGGGCHRHHSTGRASSSAPRNCQAP